MPFSQETKEEALKRSAYRCCVCHELAGEVHHIASEANGGADTLDNAAPLCASCHDLYGANSEKRRAIRRMRDLWWELMEERSKHLTVTDDLAQVARISRSEDHLGQLNSKSAALWHVVFPDEDFVTAATHLYELVKRTQEISPGENRILFLHIEGHRTSTGAFDRDMFHLQKDFILGFLLRYLSELHMPLLAARNEGFQRNDVPSSLKILFRLDQESLNELLDSDEPMDIWLADRDKWLTVESGRSPHYWGKRPPRANGMHGKTRGKSEG